MKCAECGAKSADVTQCCVLCGAPVARPASVIVAAAAEAVSDAAGGVAPAVASASAAGLTLQEPYVPGSGDRRETGRATLPEVSGAILAEWAGSRKFSVTRLRPGYDEEE